MFDEVTKEGGGGKQQPYIPAGNGEKSGEYTNKNNNQEITCTKEWLKEVLSTEEISFINVYTNPEIGPKLNKAIKNNTLSSYGRLMRDNIINAINKVCLTKDAILYRGINVDYSVYLTEFYYPYLRDKLISDYQICSTTTNFERALFGANKDNVMNIGIILQIDLPKGHNALPISSISKDPSEKEVLLNAPRYKINKIEDATYKDFKYKKIYVKIME